MADVRLKVTLSSGRTVVLKKFKIKHQRKAVEVAGLKAGDNHALLGVLVQDELLKVLIDMIDDKPVERSKLEMIDDIFEVEEYRELMKVVEEAVGGNAKSPR